MTLFIFPLQRKIVWLIVLFLLVGQIILFSATGVLGLQRYQSEFYYVIRQSIAAVSGVMLMLLIAKIPYAYYKKLSFF